MKIYVAGHSGMVGKAIVNLLKVNKGNEILTCPHEKLDLVNQYDVKKYFENQKPDVVIIAAAKVGGIHANNTYPASFIYENIMIQSNIINSSLESGVNKLLFLGSSCIYPRLAEQPMPEEALLSGQLEPTNEPYAIAKIAGIKMCESYNRQYGVDYRSVMPTNLYGPWDNFHYKNSHVVPALLRRFHDAKLNNDKEVVIWGTGMPLREFLHVDDMAYASLHVLNMDDHTYKSNTTERLSHINVGSNQEIRIADLAKLISKITGFSGEINFDETKKDGAPRKLMDSSRLFNTEWKPKIELEEGLYNTYEWFKRNQKLFRAS
jgi:GDP-L-fucose synthase